MFERQKELPEVVEEEDSWEQDEDEDEDEEGTELVLPEELVEGEVVLEPPFITIRYAPAPAAAIITTMIRITATVAIAQEGPICLRELAQSGTDREKDLRNVMPN